MRREAPASEHHIDLHAGGGSGGKMTFLEDEGHILLFSVQLLPILLSSHLTQCSLTFAVFK